MSHSDQLIGQKDWSERILDLYREGYADVEVAAELKLPVREFYEQTRKNAAFGRLVDYGRTLSEAYWVSQGRKSLKDKTFNASVWVFNMKNRFGWAEKSEQVDRGDNKAYNLDELKQKLSNDALEFIKANAPELVEARKNLEGTLKVVRNE